MMISMNHTLIFFQTLREGHRLQKIQGNTSILLFKTLLSQVNNNFPNLKICYSWTSGILLKNLLKSIKILYLQIQ